QRRPRSQEEGREQEGRGEPAPMAGPAPRAYNLCVRLPASIDRHGSVLVGPVSVPTHDCWCREGLMWANMLRRFHVGNALTNDEGPSSSMRPSRVAWAQVTWPACHLTKASASAVMWRSSTPGYVLQISASPRSMSSQ